MKNKGFTLAEVLLTLTIIGVVAALTIPAVITKMTQDQYVVALKKAYNTLKAVEREAIQENGPMESWNWTGDLTDFNIFFKPHFDILKDCGTGTDEGCFENIYKDLKGNAMPTTFEPNTNTNAKIITSDGISFSYFAAKTDLSTGWFWVDLNGKKKPNRYGRDLFAFNVFPTLGIKPQGSYYTTGNMINSSTAEAKCRENGHYCAAVVLSDGAMNY